MNNKANLKAAMDLLQVKKPLKLSTSLSFKKPTGVENETMVGNSTQVENTTQVEKETQVLRSKTEQDSSVVFESQFAEGLEKGFTRIPNFLLMKLASGDFTKNEIKLILLIARFTISFQKKHAPLSKAVLERQSGIRGPAVLEAIASLISKSVIEKIQGDQYRPNQLGIIFPTGVEFGTQVPIQTQVGNPDPAWVGKPTYPLVEKATPALVGNPTYFKYNINIKNSLSSEKLQGLTYELEKYFSEITTQKKLESEFQAFENLKTQFSLEEISQCFAFISKNGVSSGESFMPCHSPMAFLSKAMGDVLSKIRSEKSKIESNKKYLEAQQENQRKALHEAEIEETAFAKKEQVFLSQFLSVEEQQNALRPYLKNMPFQPESKIARKLAIGQWWEDNQK